VILSHNQIREAIEAESILIDPFDPDQLGPNSYDVRLSPYLLTYDDVVLDMKREPRVVKHEIPERGFTLEPNKLYLGRTVEYTETHHYVPMLEGRSSIGRLGLCIHVTAGFGDVGFRGHWTLEMFSVHPIRIYAGVRVGQLYYHDIDDVSSDTIYQGKYNDPNSGYPVPTKLWKELSCES
jgi:dCTP deaminase